MTSDNNKLSEELDNFAKNQNYDVYHALAYRKTKKHYEKNHPERWHKERLKTPAELKLYFDKAEASDGFDVSGCSGGRGVSGGIGEMCPSELGWMVPYAKFAVVQHIEDKKKKGKIIDLKFKKVVKANYQAVSGAMLYITLKARDNQDGGKLKIYRAKVWAHPHMAKEMKCDKTLEKFYEAPRKPKPSKKRKKKTETERKQEKLSKKRKKKTEREQEKPQTTPKRPNLPFDIFVEDVRKWPKLESKRNCRVLRVAEDQWRSMSSEDKARYEERAAYESVGVQTRAAKRAKNWI